MDTQGGKEEKMAEIQPGRQYEEELCVRNTGNIDQYVRVMIYRYWVDTPVVSDCLLYTSPSPRRPY